MGACRPRMLKAEAEAIRGDACTHSWSRPDYCRMCAQKARAILARRERALKLAESSGKAPVFHTFKRWALAEVEAELGRPCPHSKAPGARNIWGDHCRKCSNILSHKRRYERMKAAGTLVDYTSNRQSNR